MIWHSKHWLTYHVTKHRKILTNIHSDHSDQCMRTNKILGLIGKHWASTVSASNSTIGNQLRLDECNQKRQKCEVAKAQERQQYHSLTSDLCTFAPSPMPLRTFASSHSRIFSLQAKVEVAQSEQYMGLMYLMGLESRPKNGQRMLSDDRLSKEDIILLFMYLVQV